MEYRRGRISQEYRRWGTPAMCRLNSDLWPVPVQNANPPPWTSRVRLMEVGVHPAMRGVSKALDEAVMLPDERARVSQLRPRVIAARERVQGVCTSTSKRPRAHAVRPATTGLPTAIP